jgi:5'-nucleotidase
MGRARRARLHPRPLRRLGAGVVGALVAVALLAACSDDGNGSGSANTDTTRRTTTTAPEPETLEILLTNDDGYAAPGIDAIATALMAEPNVEVTIVAPAANQSGTGDRTTPGTLTTQSVTTTSGIAATAVAGYPADTVNVALAELDLEPDLVVSGINFGQNIGPSVDISGTVGAAKEAVRRGIPALAVSQGLADQPDYATGVQRALDWFRANRDGIAASDAAPPTTLTNLNIPTCTSGVVGATLTVAVATDFADRNIANVTCSASPAPTATFADDVDAFINGYATLSEVPAR